MTTPRPPALAFSHIGIFVQDLARMRDFYTRVLGFFLTDEGLLSDVPIAFLSRDPDEHHQIVLVAGRPSVHHFNVVNQISFRASSLADLRRFHASLAGEDVSEVAPVTHGNSWSVYLRDPEGNRLEIFVDSPWYVEQPTREPIDFSLSDDELYADTLERCRGRRGFISQAERREKMVRLMTVE
jgi:catechol-2,3-dioxygenase